MAQTYLDMESLQVNPSNDQEVTERVRARLAGVLADLSFEVRARAGIVTLSGQIRDSAQSRAASMLTHRVEGVTNVVNKLTIGRGITPLPLSRPSSPGRAKAAGPRRARRASATVDAPAVPPSPGS